MIAFLVIVLLPLSPLDPARAVVSIAYPTMAECQAVLRAGRVSAESSGYSVAACIASEGAPS